VLTQFPLKAACAAAMLKTKATIIAIPITRFHILHLLTFAVEVELLPKSRGQPPPASAPSNNLTPA
jgi:hypothetical protein